MKITGVVTSPNHPDVYPPNLEKTYRLEVESGKILRLEFTRFDIQGVPYACPDFIRITDGDDTTLMDNKCSCCVPPQIITTRTNRVEIFFHTDDLYPATGWSLSWSAVTPGEKAFN